MINYKTSAIDLNVPAKVLSCTVTSSANIASWPHNDGQGDRWWEGASNSKAYRWEITVGITPVNHGSHLTRTPFEFNGFDVVVGDFIAGATDGRALQIVSISSKTSSTVICQVEDRLRYNTFRSPAGTGIFTIPGGAVIFQLNENGDPMIDPLPIGVVSQDFYANINSRFKYLNPSNNYLLNQDDHGFEEGDVICMNESTGLFEVSNAFNIERLVGTVTHPGPGPNIFMLRPANGLIDFVPGLPGTAGDFIYPSIDGSGDLTTDKANVAIFLKIKNAVESVVRGTVTSGSGVAGDSLIINGTTVRFLTSTQGVVTVSNAVSDINTQTAEHKVLAERSSAPNIIESDPSTYGSAYGLVGGFPPFSATFNGQPVDFITFAAGAANFGMNVAVAEDMANDINAAKLSGITATFSDGNLVLSENNGGGITIVNVATDVNGNNFAGMNSASSLNTSYSAGASAYVLQLSREDGGEIILTNGIGTPTSDFGITSGHNGSYAIGLNVEQGVRKAGTLVVVDIAARDALTGVLTGDGAYVLDTGENEWGLYIYNGSQWALVATQDSAATDANSISHTFEAPIGGFGISQNIILGRISDNSRVVSVLVEVLTEITGYDEENTPELVVGTTLEPDRLMSDYENDIESSGSYTTNPDFHYVGETELEVRAKLSHFNATDGIIKVTVTYV
jgi:hypothetical protein